MYNTIRNYMSETYGNEVVKSAVAEEKKCIVNVDMLVTYL